MTLRTSRATALGLLLFTVASLALLALLSARFGGPTVTTSEPLRRTALIEDAQGLPTRADVLVRGVRVGQVGTVSPDGSRTRIELELDPDDAPALHRTASLRLGTKTPLGEPFVDLDPGTGGPLRGTRIRAKASVEVDEALEVLEPGARRSLTSVLETAARGVRSPAAPARLGATLQSLERVTDALGRTGTILKGQEPALGAVVRDAGTVLRTTADDDARVRELVGGARATLTATAQQRASLAAALQELPPTLAQARGTLARARPLLQEAQPLVTDLERAAPALRTALTALPPALADTATVLRNAPALQRTARPALKGLDQAIAPGVQATKALAPALANAVPMVRYVDDHRQTVAAWFSNTADLGVNGDAKGKWARFFVGFEPSTVLGLPGSPPGNAYSTAGDGTAPKPYASGDFPRLQPYRAALRTP